METQKLVLDKSKWICGQPEWNKQKSNCLGKGHTKLLNEDGYMCCLGQFSKQLSKEVTDNMLMSSCSPHGLNSGFGVVIESLMTPLNLGDYRNNELAQDAISINDDVQTSVKNKLSLLKSLFAKYNYEIEVIN